MASTGGVTLDKVVIQIESSADRANSNLKGLSKTLVELRSSLKGGFHNLEKLAESLEKLNKSSAGIKNIASNLQSLSTVTDSLKGLSEISSPTGLKKTIDNLEKLPTTFEKITPDTIANVARVSEQLARALTPLANKMADIGNGFSKMQMLADRYGVSVTKVRENNKSTTSGLNKMKSLLNGVGNGFKKAVSFAANFLTIGKRTFSALEKPLSKTTKKIRQMGMALLSVRSVFTFTRKAIDEYTQMDSVLQESIQNTWRAMGAQLAPVVEFMINLFHQFVRVIYSVIMALTGIDLIARANDKAMKSWSKSAKDALGNLQKFDDLNVVEFPKAAGDENKLIEMDSIDLSPIQKIMDWVTEMKNSIKEALDTGKWSNVGVVFGKGINGALDLFVAKLPVIQEKLDKVATGFGEFLNGAVSEIHWDNVGKSLFSIGTTIRNTLTTAIATVDWKQIGKAINTTLQNIRFEDIVNSWVNLISVALSSIGDVLANIDFTTLGEKIRTTIQSVDWKTLWDSIVVLMNEAFIGAADFLDGLFSTNVFSNISEDISDVITKLGKLITKTSETILVNEDFKNLLSTIDSIFSSIWDFAVKIVDKLLDLAISDDFQNVIKDVSSIFNGIYDTIRETIDWVIRMYDQYIDPYLDDLVAVISEISSLCEELWIDVLKPIIDPILKFIQDMIEPLFERLIPIILDIFKFLKNILSFVVNVFKGDWKKAWDAMGDAIKNIDNIISSLFKAIINFLITLLEKGINNLFINNINKLIRKYNDTVGKVADKIGINIKIKEMSFVSIPRLETGTNEIPYEGIYHLHPGEAVVPKKYNPALGNGGNEETNQKLDRLISIMDNMSFTNVVNIGNKTLYKEQQKYNKSQNNKYGTLNT